MANCSYKVHLENIHLDFKKEFRSLIKREKGKEKHFNCLGAQEMVQSKEARSKFSEICISMVAFYIEILLMGHSGGILYNIFAKRKYVGQQIGRPGQMKHFTFVRKFYLRNLERQYIAKEVFQTTNFYQFGVISIRAKLFF